MLVAFYPNAPAILTTRIRSYIALASRSLPNSRAKHALKQSWNLDHVQPIPQPLPMPETCLISPGLREQRVALVTGASQGIGRAIALRLASDGFCIALNDLPANLNKLASVCKEITEKGGVARAVPADVSDESQVALSVQRC
jgi:hypothetical protein